MEEQKPVEESKTGIKQALWSALNKAAIDLINQTISAKSLKWFLIFWISISFMGSLYKRHQGTCSYKMPINKYFAADLLCVEGELDKKVEETVP